ncbi:ubiquitin-like-conjugating enzyme ATG10 [Plodia interpunctella]|uniref:ubiquitin-like-conjugating enzyme ATG10 n=1 Tax=Plodia interpunctella TaxID=58824 RepID=UPI002367B9E5|nr:ubiquitin-like-conjugating enzyme ATG10 [Plodia interpunctella]XP_053612422.1 ubiquitin-like-conjugating enzyme ATG10 [Plodia interpunctella]
MDLDVTLAPEEYLEAAIRFCNISDTLNDDWKIIIDEENPHKSYLIKNTFVTQDTNGPKLCKAELVIFYNLHYGVPAFSFNIWNSSGVLLTLDEIREMTFVKIKEKDFYTVITQQEHPLFSRPYFVMHPCHTAELIHMFKNSSNNIIVTFLGLITPLLNINLPMGYGVSDVKDIT